MFLNVVLKGPRSGGGQIFSFKGYSPGIDGSLPGAYGNLSVSYYSGTPGINIPLFEIKTPGHTLPIRLQHDATGIRVNENAGWVGLDWSK